MALVRLDIIHVKKKKSFSLKEHTHTQVVQLIKQLIEIPCLDHSGERVF